MIVADQTVSQLLKSDCVQSFDEVLV